MMTLYLVSVDLYWRYPLVLPLSGLGWIVEVSTFLIACCSHRWLNAMSGFDHRLWLNKVTLYFSQYNWDVMMVTNVQWPWGSKHKNIWQNTATFQITLGGRDNPSYLWLDRTKVTGQSNMSFSVSLPCLSFRMSLKRMEEEFEINNVGHLYDVILDMLGLFYGASSAYIFIIWLQ